MTELPITRFWLEEGQTVVTVKIYDWEKHRVAEEVRTLLLRRFEPQDVQIMESGRATVDQSHGCWVTAQILVGIADLREAQVWVTDQLSSYWSRDDWELLSICGVGGASEETPCPSKS